MSQIGRFVNDSNTANWNDVQGRPAPCRGEEIKNSGMGGGGGSLAGRPDPRWARPDLKRLGRRMANLACHDLYPTMKSCGPVPAVVPRASIRPSADGGVIPP